MWPSSGRGWIFVADNLMTHCSATLVLLVAGLCVIPAESLGAKHTSWMNQIEIGFSVLSRRVIRRGAFRSTDDLRDRILKFIDYFNRTMAKLYKWTYAGRPLNV